jgi:hypothetical protein
MHPDDWRTPFEAGNGDQTTTWEACIDFYTRLAAAHPARLRFGPIGTSDAGTTIHAGMVCTGGVDQASSPQGHGRPVLFINNGIHPGEPEGIDACMSLVRDICLGADPRHWLGDVVLVFLPVYNVDGMRNRGNTSRVNQCGPEAFGFRGNGRHLDLNRDFIKSASLEAQTFHAFFRQWDPDVMVDTHTSNGADYQHVMTLIATQPDKLGGRCRDHLRHTMLPKLYAGMEARGFPMCPYVNPVRQIPDDGIADFPDTPRFSTGYAALHHTIGFMPETHMLKPYPDRVASMRALLDVVLACVVEDGATIQQHRAADRAAFSAAQRAPLRWALDDSQASSFRFHGYRAEFLPSKIGLWQRLRYDRQSPWERDIPYFDRCRPVADAALPRAYLLPQAWREVAERLERNGVRLLPLAADRLVQVEAWHLSPPDKHAQPFEGQHLHGRICLAARPLQHPARAGDWLIPLGTPHDRFAFETLEPDGADSFYRWGFFDAVLDRKETFSDYLFEDEAERLLLAEPALRASFNDWVRADPQRLHDGAACLAYIHQHAQRYREPEWRRFPVLRIVDPTEPLVP